MNIGVVGCGVVGRSIVRTYLEFSKEIRVWDIIPERATHSLEETLHCDIIFVCLPTPRGNGGKLDCTDIHNYFNSVRKHTPILLNQNFVLRSTVPIGITKELQREYNLPNLVHSPEFLTARCAETDAMIPACNIIGLSGNGYNAPELRELYKRRFPGTNTLITSSDESEAIKLFTNGFYAVKVAYFNEIRCLADKLNLDWDTIVSGMLAQGRTAPYHYKVPGPDGVRGFGGACLEKDISHLAVQILENGLTAAVTSAALNRNVNDRKETG